MLVVRAKSRSVSAAVSKNWFTYLNKLHSSINIRIRHSGAVVKLSCPCWQDGSKLSPRKNIFQHLSRSSRRQYSTPVVQEKLVLDSRPLERKILGFSVAMLLDPRRSSSMVSLLPFWITGIYFLTTHLASTWSLFMTFPETLNRMSAMNRWIPKPENLVEQTRARSFLSRRA